MPLAPKTLIDHGVEQAFMPLAPKTLIDHGVEQAFMPAFPTPKKSWALAPAQSAFRLPKKPIANCFSYLIPPNAPLNFCVALNNVFLAVSSVVFSISPIVRNLSP